MDRFPALPCMCGSLRRASRALTQAYEEALRASGLRPTQLTVLQVLARAGELPQGRLGEMLALDSTTLTRTLRVMLRENWISERRGEDRRERLLTLSRTGVSKLDEALPLWEKAQSRLRRQLGQERWDRLMQLSHQLTELTSAKGGIQ